MNENIENCDETKPQVTRPCRKCGAPIPWGPNQRCFQLCEKCVSPFSILNRKKKRYCPSNPDIKHDRDYWNKIKKNLYDRKKAFVDQPCYFCDYKDCSGVRKMIVGIANKTFVEETGYKQVGSYPKNKLYDLLDSGRFLLMCTHHGTQYNRLRYLHLWTHEQVIEEMIRRMTPEAAKE